MAYVCICTPTTDKEIIQEIKKCKTLEQVIYNLNICQNCKTCSKELVNLFSQFKTN